MNLRGSQIDGRGQRPHRQQLSLFQCFEMSDRNPNLACVRFDCFAPCRFSLPVSARKKPLMATRSK